ncbi:MAG: hypothetical protein ACPGU6_05070 [Tenacibaculum sp.]
MKIRLFKSELVYILLFKNRLKIYRLDNGKSIDRTSIKPFSNSRLLLGDFQRFEVFLKELIEELFKKDNYLIAPPISMLMHQLEMKEGGVTPVEKRAMVDSARHSNAKEFFLFFSDKELTLKQALAKIKNKEGTYLITDS